MTFREKLADWISGSALSYAREDVEFWKGRYYRATDSWEDTLVLLNGATKSLREIRNVTRGIQSGTAQKIQRMAKEALGDE